MIDPKQILTYAASFFGLFFLLFLAEPLLGAWITFRWYDKAKISGPPFKNFTQAFFFASSGMIIALFGLNAYLASQHVSQVAQLSALGVAYVAVQLVLVPLLLRSFAPRALLIQGGSILAASAAAFVTLYMILA